MGRYDGARAKLSVRSEFRGLLTGLALVGAVVLVAVSTNLGVPGQELLSTLRFHIGAGLLLLPILLLLTGARWRALAMLGVVGLSLGQGASIVLEQQQRRDPLLIDVAQGSFRLLSFNVLGGNRRASEAAAFIADSGADVAVVMEAMGVATELETIAARYPYRLGCEASEICDLAIFSRTPLVNAQKLVMPGIYRQRLNVATTTIDGHAVTIVAVHLAKPYYDDTVVYELQAVERVLDTIDGPVVLTGDFNAAAWSNQIAEFAEALQLVPPPGYPATWPVRMAALGVPIDNMFTRGGALIRNSQATEALGSNHRGLIANVDLF